MSNREGVDGGQSQRLALRRFCRTEARAARGKLLLLKGQFDRGYWLGISHAYEMLLKHKLRKP